MQIGEECTVHIESGGWFGFETPGYDYIEFEDVQVVDNLPDGQGYISSTDPFAPGYSTAQITGRQPEPAAESPLGRRTSSTGPITRATASPTWTTGSASMRPPEFLNDPIDSRAPPNVHAR